jgi:hypothetical protein
VKRREVGRTLGLLRRTAGLSRPELAIAIEAPVARVRDLEVGRAELGYLEGLRLAKAVLCCPTCFRRQVESADARGGLGEAPEADRLPCNGDGAEDDDAEPGRHRESELGVATRHGG